VPKLKPGLVDIKLVNPDGKQVIKQRAFRVTSREAVEVILPFTESAEKMDIAGEFHDDDGGIVFGDYNNDGWDDALVTNQRTVRLFMNNSGEDFIEVTDMAGLHGKRCTHGGVWADLDNDGFLDIIIAYTKPVILKNTGKGTFEDVSDTTGIPSRQYLYMPTCADYNLDGYVDIFFTGYSRPDMLLRNEGNFKFTPMFGELFKDYQFMTPSAAWGDYDNDGYPDLFVVNVGNPCRLYHNIKGERLEDVAQKAGVDNQNPRSSPENLKYSPAWGAMWADFDNDGWLDLMVANFAERNRLYHNRGDSTFENIAPTVGLGIADDAMGISAADFNNDGYLDLFMNNIMSSFNFYVNEAGGMFRNVTKEAGLDYKNYSSHGSAWADINHDGAMDLYIVNNIRPNFLYMNQPYPGTHYLQVKLAGKKSNAAAIGARAVAQAGHLKMTRIVKGSHSYISQDSLVLHFGLGKTEKVDVLKIHWPSGILQELKDIPADQRMVITEPVE
jgi:hypothetical protein